MINLNSLSRKLLLLQRNELITKRQKWLRKKFGRFIFTNILINYFQDKYLEKNTENLFSKEIETFKNYLPNSPKNIMDIGCGLGIIDIYLNRIFKNRSLWQQPGRWTSITFWADVADKICFCRTYKFGIGI